MHSNSSSNSLKWFERKGKWSLWKESLRQLPSFLLSLCFHTQSHDGRSAFSSVCSFVIGLLSNLDFQILLYKMASSLSLKDLKEQALIEAVRPLSCLYNKRDPNYRNKSMKRRIWAQLAKQIGYSGKHFVPSSSVFATLI